MKQQLSPHFEALGLFQVMSLIEIVQPPLGLTHMQNIEPCTFRLTHYFTLALTPQKEGPGSPAVMCVWGLCSEVALVWKHSLSRGILRSKPWLSRTCPWLHTHPPPQPPRECGVNHLYRNPYIPSKAERSPWEGSVSKLVATEGCITEDCIIRLQVCLIHGWPSQRGKSVSHVLICNIDCDCGVRAESLVMVHVPLKQTLRLLYLFTSHILNSFKHL